VTEAEGAGGRHVSFRVDLPSEEIAGHYANFLSVWHTPHEFTLDFAATQPPQVDEDDPDAPVVVPCQVVARVKIPVSLVFDVLKALNENMTKYEARFGPITGPRGEGVGP